MTDRIEELIREIAHIHGIAVARDDPILVLQTINNRLLQDSAKAQQEQLDAYKEEMEALSHRWGLDARDKAERILNASLTASNDATAKIMAKSGEAAGSLLHAEIDVALARLNQSISDAQRVGSMNFCASIITMVAASIALWATFST